MPSRVLIVEDEPDIRALLAFHLEREGYQVARAASGADALRQVRAARPDLVLLDLMLPEMDGLEVCRRLRQDPATAALPIVMLTAKGEEVDRVLGLELGGDDYVTKPFSPRELVSRVKAVLRRSGEEPETSTGTLQLGDVRLDPHEVRVFAGKTELELTATEFRLLQVLMTKPGRVYTRDELMSRGYEGAHFVSGRTLDSHIRRIRKKFKDTGRDPIETVHGMGFRMRKEP